MLKFLAVLVLFASPTWGQAPFQISIDRFCGINDSLVSSKIPDCDAQDAENVLTDGGSLEQMFGMNIFIAEGLAGFPIKNAWEFIALDGTEFFIFHASDTVFQTDLSGSPVALTNVAEDFDIDAVSAFGKIFFASRGDDLWFFDGTSTDVVTGIFCKYIEFGDERIYCANTDISGSELKASAFGDFTDFTVPPDVSELPDAANSFTFQKEDGEEITCLKVTPWGKFVGKPRSGHILKGLDNESFYKRIINPSIGCNDDRLVQMLDGVLIWLSIEGVYSWAGGGSITWISRKIENRIKQIRQLTAETDFILINTQVDWEKGSATTNGADSWSTTIVPGEIRPSSVTFLDTSQTDWLQGSGSGVFDSSGSVTASSDTFKDDFSDLKLEPTWTVVTASANANAGFMTSVTLDQRALIETTDIKSTTGSWKFKHRYRLEPGLQDVCVDINVPCFEFRFVQNAGGDYYAVRYVFGIFPTPLISFELLKKIAGVETVFVSTGVGYAKGSFHDWEISRSTDGVMSFSVDGVFHASATDVDITSSVAVGIEMIRTTLILDIDIRNDIDDVDFFAYNPESIFISDVKDSTFIRPIDGPFSSTFTVVAAEEEFVFFDVRTATSASGVFTDFFPTSDTLRMGATQQFVQYQARLITLSTSTPSLDEVGFAFKSTGTYTLDVRFIGEEITSFRSADYTDTQDPAGVLAFEVRTATFVFASTNTTIPFVSQPNHTTVVVATGSFYQTRIISSIDSSTQTAIVARHQVNWKEGESSPGASIVDDHRYIMCVTVGSNSVSNDTCEILQKNNEWTRLTGKSISALTEFSNDSIAGDGSTASEFWEIMVEGVSTFAGDTIDAFWITKDFRGDQIFSDKTIREIWFDAEQSDTDSLDIGYAVNKSTTFVDKTLELNIEAQFFNRKRDIDDGFARGRYLKFRIRNADAGEDFEANNLTIFGETEPRFQ